MFLDGLNSVLVSTIRDQITFIQLVLENPPSFPNDAIMGLLTARSWGFYQILAVAVVALALIMLPLMAFSRRKLGAGIRTIAFGFVTVMVGGAFFYKFLDLLQNVSLKTSQWLLGSNPIGDLFVLQKGSLAGTLLNVITLAVSGYYIAAIMVLFYVLMLLVPVFKLCIFPLGLLMSWFKWAKWLFDWLLTIGILGIFLAAPVVIGVLGLAKYANQVFGTSSPLAAAISLLAGMVIAKRYLYKALKGVHRTIVQHTEEMRSNVRGRVETNWRDRPHMDANQNSSRYAQAAVPPPKEASMRNKVTHSVTAVGLGKAAEVVAASTIPGAVVGVAAIEVYEQHHRKKAGLPAQSRTNKLKVGANSHGN